MRIVYGFADNPLEWESSERRCAVPAQALNRSGIHAAELISLTDLAHNPAKAEKVCGPAEVIVVERNLSGKLLPALQHWKARGKILVADFSEASPLFPPGDPEACIEGQGLIRQPEAARGASLPLNQLGWGLRLIDAATVPSRRLVEDWRAYTPVHYLPDYLDLEKYVNVTQEPHEGIVIGCGDDPSHLPGLLNSGVAIALQRICLARPEVKVMVCGQDARVMDRLSLPAGQAIFQSWVPYSRWSQVLSRFDIGLAPYDGACGERRSWIKALEYMLMKIPWVASDGPAYHDLRAYGWLVSNAPSAWERILLDMVDHLEDYKLEASRETYLFALSQGVDENMENIVKVYTTISDHSGLAFGSIQRPYAVQAFPA